MENEKQQIALRFKGEYYKDCVQVLQAEGFQSLGLNEWVSPATGNHYRFMMADGGKYVTRVEYVDEEGSHIIRTEFFDHQEAMERYNAEYSQSNLSVIKMAMNGFKDTRLQISLSKVLRMIENGCKEDDADAVILRDYICSFGEKKLTVKHYLFCDGNICFYSPNRRNTHELVRVVEYEGDKYYIYRARYYLEDLLESLVSKVKLYGILGEETVNGLNEQEELK